jgi:hypothetical protein
LNSTDGTGAEDRRLLENRERRRNWQRWGPYLAERQWGTVREDYSLDENAWNYFPHEQARSRAYRWGEDGLLGLCDRKCRLAFALALWNGQDPLLKERLFGLSGPQGNHGEDVKECYWYLDATPTHSYLRSVYRYPQAVFPYQQLVAENARRGREVPEFELEDTGVFAWNRFFDVQAEYAKGSPEDIAILITVFNRAPDEATLHVLPTLWFRNVWSWGRSGEGYGMRPRLRLEADGSVHAEHPQLGAYRLVAAPGPDGNAPTALFTENETDTQRLFGAPNASPYVKDAFHAFLIEGRRDAVSPAGTGSKAALLYRLTLPPQGEATLRLRLFAHGEAPGDDPLGKGHDQVFADRRREADEFYGAHLPPGLDPEETRIMRQAYAGLLHSRQFYHYIVEDWLEGDPAEPQPPPERRQGRNHEWTHLYNRDVVSMPDKWEYPWYAAWDLAFHMIPFTRLDPDFAKAQLVLFLREWYMHPSGALPAYEFGFGDANPPVHAWAAWRVYKMTAARGRRDLPFLARVFQKLLLNFTWWVNRKDVAGQNLFSGGFLGLDNIGVFDRSKPLPTGGQLEQADGTAWMAFFCGTMLSIGLELAREDPVYEDLASKFFEHFVAIVDAMNSVGGTGLWDEEDGFYYDRLFVNGQTIPLRIRSLVGLVPLIAVEVLERDVVSGLPGFAKRLDWFLANRQDLARHISYFEACIGGQSTGRLLAIPSPERLRRVLRYLLDENEFLSPYGIRSLSRYHAEHPFVFRVGAQEYRVAYTPGEADSGLFGGNSNWRGPVWLPMNFLLVEALERYHHFYGDTLQVECPTGSGRMLDLGAVAQEILRRVAGIFLPDANGRRPHQGTGCWSDADPAAREWLQFHEYFHAETGRGLGASHQTGWTALVATCLEKLARRRPAPGA